MQSTFDQLGDLVTKVTDIAETKVEIFKLRAAQKISLTLSSIITMMAIVFIGGLVMVVISIGMAFLIGPLMGNISYGFFAVGGFYVLAGFILYLFRKKILSGPLSNLIIDKSVQ